MSDKNLVSRVTRKKYYLVFTVFMKPLFYARQLLNSEGINHEAAHTCDIGVCA